MAASHRTECPHAEYHSDKSVLCDLQRGNKWSFCIHQYFCREKGRYLLNDHAANCKLREKEVR